MGGIKVFILLIFLILGRNAHAEWDLFGETERTSDSVTRKTVSLQYQQKRQDLQWAYDNEPKRGEKIFGISATANQWEYGSFDVRDAGLSGSYGIRLTDDKHLTGSLGFVNLRSDKESSKNLFTPEILFDWKMTETFFASFNYKHGYVFQELIIGLNQLDVLQADTVGINILTRGNNWRVPARANAKWLSDGNRRFDADAEMKFALDQEKDWIWIGAGGTYTASNRRENYWTPMKSLTFGPRFEFTILAKDPDMSLFGEIDAYVIDEDSTYNNGYSARIGLLKGDRNASQFKISGFVIDSTQNGGGWKTEGITLQLMF